MFCPNCGTEIKGNFKFCPTCGGSINLPENFVNVNDGNTFKKQTTTSFKTTNSSNSKTIEIVGTILAFVNILYICLWYIGGFSAQVFYNNITVTFAQLTEFAAQANNYLSYNAISTIKTSGTMYIFISFASLFFCIYITYINKNLPFGKVVPLVSNILLLGIIDGLINVIKNQSTLFESAINLTGGAIFLMFTLFAMTALSVYFLIKK